MKSFNFLNLETRSATMRHTKSLFRKWTGFNLRILRPLRKLFLNPRVSTDASMVYHVFGFFLVKQCLSHNNQPIMSLITKGIAQLKMWAEFEMENSMKWLVIENSGNTFEDGSIIISSFLSFPICMIFTCMATSVYMWRSLTCFHPCRPSYPPPSAPTHHPPS